MDSAACKYHRGKVELSWLEKESERGASEEDMDEAG